jgi:hypothetical protein
MMKPTRRALAMQDTGAPHVIYASGRGPSGNPRLYKYLFRVFSPESPWESDEFFSQSPLLSVGSFYLEAGRLLNAGKSCVVYIIRRPRLDPANPWDLSSPRWQGATFAPSWDEDPDPVVDGGHR